MTTPPIRDWETLVAFALTLPGTHIAPYYGKPAVKVIANDRAFLSDSSEPGSFVLQIDRDTKAMLIETDPDTYWETPHYNGWPSLLVRYDTADPERMAAMIARACDQAAARRAARPRKAK